MRADCSTGAKLLGPDVPPMPSGSVEAKESGSRGAEKGVECPNDMPLCPDASSMAGGSIGASELTRDVGKSGGLGVRVRRRSGGLGRGRVRDNLMLVLEDNPPSGAPEGTSAAQAWIPALSLPVKREM